MPKQAEAKRDKTRIVVRPGAREESASPAWLPAPAMNACDTTKVYIYGGLTLDVDRHYIGSVTATTQFYTHKNHHCVVYVANTINDQSLRGFFKKFCYEQLSIHKNNVRLTDLVHKYSSFYHTCTCEISKELSKYEYLK